MNVTSMLSNGYLQPFHNANVPRSVEEDRSSVDQSAKEQQPVEKAPKTAHGPEANVSATTYQHTIGADGHRYITGANMLTEDDASSSEAHADVVAGRKKADLSEKPEKNNKEDVFSETDMETEAVVRELKRIEQEVIAHEAAHQAAGGGLTGAASYTYTQGPDGRSYITGGEVSIRVPVSDDPEQTLRDMEQVQTAALAPNNPSAQDFSVAAKAAATAANARQEVAAKNREPDQDESVKFSPGISFVKAGLLFERIHEEQGEAVSISIIEELPDNAVLDPIEAYHRNASNRGLWTLKRGFEPVPKKAVFEPGFDIAA